MFYHSPLLQPLIEAAGAAQQQTVLYTAKYNYTAKELLADSKQLAFQLVGMGMKKDDMVVVAITPGVEFIVMMYATIMVRARVAIIDPEMGTELYRAKFNQLKPNWAFVDTRLLLLQEHKILRFVYFKLANKPVYFPPYEALKIISCGPKLPLFQRYIAYGKLLKGPAKDIHLDADPEDFDYLITYTSGTISEPKGVLHSFSALHKSLSLLIKVVDNKPGDRLGTYLPHFALMGIAAQLPVVLYDAKWSAKKKMDFFELNKVSHLFGPPSDFLPLIKYCESNKRKLPSAIKHIMVGSAPVHKSFLQSLVNVSNPNLRITVIYGMTEHLLISTVDGTEKINYTRIGDLVGKLVQDVEVKIAEDGELLVKSDQLFSRYFHLDKRDEFHASGDLARIDESGNAVLMGRKKEMIIRGNTNIYPALYEGTIKMIPGIDEASFVGIYNNDKADEEVFLAIEASQRLTAKQVMNKISFGEFQIEKNALPDEIFFMQIPRKGRQNKIDRAKIIEIIKAQKA